MLTVFSLPEAAGHSVTDRQTGGIIATLRTVRRAAKVASRRATEFELNLSCAETEGRKLVASAEN